MNALYDLSTSPANFNFLEFLVTAITHKADHIVLDDSKGYKKFHGEVLKERMRSIVEPACMLGRCTFSYQGKGQRFDYHVSSVLKTYKEIGEIKKLSSMGKGSEEFTVTLRDYSRYPERNSGPDWRRFSKDIGAFLIEDYGVKKIPLHERMSLYAGARMNFFVGNGPALLCFYSDCPYMAFMKNVNIEYHKEHGWYKEQLPWANEDQKCLWTNDDSYPRLMEAFECLESS